MSGQVALRRAVLLALQQRRRRCGVGVVVECFERGNVPPRRISAEPTDGRIPATCLVAAFVEDDGVVVEGAVRGPPCLVPIEELQAAVLGRGVEVLEDAVAHRAQLGELSDLGARHLVRRAVT